MIMELWLLKMCIDLLKKKGCLDLKLLKKE